MSPNFQHSRKKYAKLSCGQCHWELTKKVQGIAITCKYINTINIKNCANPKLLEDITIPTKCVITSPRWPLAGSLNNELSCLPLYLIESVVIMYIRLIIINKNDSTCSLSSETHLLEFDSMKVHRPELNARIENNSCSQNRGSNVLVCADHGVSKILSTAFLTKAYFLHFEYKH